MTKHKSTEAFRSKRYVINEDEESSSFCGLNDNKKREKMREESERLIEDEYEDFKSRYKRQTTNTTERNCCYVYIRVDPTLWDIVNKNEGLNVRKKIFFIIFLLIIFKIGKRSNYSCSCYIFISNSNSSKCNLSFSKISI
jgi:hypothetical protein